MSELPGTDEVVVAFSKIFGRSVVSAISLPLPIILGSVALLVVMHKTELSFLKALRVSLSVSFIISFWISFSPREPIKIIELSL